MKLIESIENIKSNNLYCTKQKFCDGTIVTYLEYVTSINSIGESYKSKYISLSKDFRERHFSHTERNWSEYSWWRFDEQKIYELSEDEILDYIVDLL